MLVVYCNYTNQCLLLLYAREATLSSTHMRERIKCICHCCLNPLKFQDVSCKLPDVQCTISTSIFFAQYS